MNRKYEEILDNIDLLIEYGLVNLTNNIDDIIEIYGKDDIHDNWDSEWYYWDDDICLVLGLTTNEVYDILVYITNNNIIGDGKNENAYEV